jgi:uncharacterized protein (TIGR02453 family)
MKTSVPRFTRGTLPFLKKASRQKRADWLERNREDYEKHVLLPLQHLARSLKSELAPVATGYHFPQKGIGRLKRSANRALEYGAPFKDYVSYSATRPSESRFDHNPNLYFLMQVDDPDGDDVLVAGGLYVPSSRQVRSIREAIAADATPIDRLFASKDFAACFPGGFSDERKSSRPPRGFDPAHPRMDWLKLQSFFVWKPYKKREFVSQEFPRLLARDWKQILRLNELLTLAIQGRWSKASPPAAETRSRGLITRLDDVEIAPRRKMDF